MPNIITVGVRLPDEAVKWLDWCRDNGPPEWRNLSRSSLIRRIIEQAQATHKPRSL